MRCNVTLLKTKLNPANTRLFDTKSSQLAYFENLKKNGLVFNDCSFNGSRNIKLRGNSMLYNLQGYNYCMIELPQIGNYYCFIDRFNYVNDITHELEVTLDYLQTYMFDINLYNTIVKQKTLSKTVNYTNKYINKYLYYSNSLPFADREYNNVKPLYTEFKGKNIKFLCISIKSSNALEYTASYGNSGIFTVIFPAEIKDDKYTIINYIDSENNLTSYSQVFFKYQAQILNMALVDIPNVLIFEEENGYSYYSSNGAIQTYTIDNMKLPVFAKPIIDNINFEIDIDLLNRNPYSYIAIKRAGDDDQILDILSLNKNINGNKYSINGKYLISPLYPYDTFIKFDTIDDTVEFTIPALATNIAYSVSEWAEYYSSYSSSIKDGLATKHSYDIEVIKNNERLGVVKTGMNLLSNLGNVVGSGMDGGYGKVLSGVTSTIADLGMDIASTVISYQNSQLGLQQEKALLELSWKDIQNRPNKAYNADFNSNAKIGIKEKSTYIAITKPLDIEMVKRYHERFGYEINMPIADGLTLNQISTNIFNEISKGNKFDYMELKGCVMLNPNVPQNACRIIEQILEQGIFFWYNDNIGDYENNY